MATDSNVAPEVLSEIPPALTRCLLLITKAFYSREQCVLVYYVMINTCINEEKLRRLLGFEQKYSRQLVVGLKQDKLLRERLVQKKAVGGKSSSLIYYFINYRALVNVVKYKIEHMRERLEKRATARVQKAAYRCISCSAEYDAMEMDRIMDWKTGMLSCWRCHGQVEQQDMSAHLHEGARALFNRQLTPIFELLRQLDGIQLAPHLYEPHINKFLEMDEAETEKAAADKATRSFATHELGGRSFSSIHYRHAEEITVCMHDAVAAERSAGKEVPVWLLSSDEAAAAAQAIGHASQTSDRNALPTPSVLPLQLHELAAIEEREEGEKEKIEHNSEENIEADEDSTDDELYVRVQGKQIPLDEINQEMVEKMTEEERAHYVLLAQRIAADEL